MLWPKLIRTRGESGSGSGSRHINSTVSVNQEYVEAFRTKSYTEIWSKVQGLLQPSSGSQQRRLSRCLSSSLCPSISSYSYTYLSDHLLEPPQHILMEMIQTVNLHSLIVDYFQGGLDASRTCGFLLQAIYQTRANYCKIQKVIKLTKRPIPECADSSSDDDRLHYHHAIFDELASFAMLDNPLSGSNPVHFNVIHNQFGSMLDQLEVTRNRIAKKSKSIRICTKASKVILTVACTALATVTVVLAIHSLVGVVAAPALITTYPLALSKLKKKMKKFAHGMRTSKLNKVVAQLDAAAKAIYILNRDFDTMSRLVMRLYDEIEHCRAIARLCVSSHKKHMLKEVVKEYEIHESCFLKQLGELEEHVHLCILTINRARRLVIQEIFVDNVQINCSKS